MDENGGKTSRRDRRKEARVAKNKKKFDSWVNHQQSSKLKKKSKPEAKNDRMEQPPVEKLQVKAPVEKLQVKAKDLKTEENRKKILKTGNKVKKLKGEKGSSKSSVSNFSKFLNLEMEGKVLSADEDLRFERRLAKKLKVKNGRLTAANDDHDMLLEGIPSFLDHNEESAQVPKVDEYGASHGRSEKDSFPNEDSEEEESTDVSDELDDEISTDEEYVDSDSPVASSEEETLLPEDSSKRKRKKSKFEEYLESDIQGGNNLDEADLALERKYAKKLKVNEGKVWGEADGMDMLLDGIPSVLDSKNAKRIKNAEDYPKKNITKNPYLSEHEQVEQGINSDAEASEPVETSPAEVSVEKLPNKAPAKYVAPHLRSSVGNESEQHAQVRKRVRGLLNRLSETNVESITSEISALSQSVGRSIGSQIIIEEVVTSCSGGPRGSEQYAAIFGAFVAGMACLVGVDFGAKLLERLAKCFEEEYLKEDNLSLRNLTLLLSYLYIFGVCSSELLYDFLIVLSARLTEVDVSTVLTVLQCCGMKLRGDDPVGMKNFISSVQSRVNELKASSGNGQSNTNSKRMEFMLETIFDIKNNRKRSAEDTPQHTRIKKWLQKLRVVDILIRGLKWSKLLDPHKKGQWWLSGDMASTAENIEDVAGTIDKEIPETKKMLQLAAAQRMNTDARRAIFCVIMSGEDYVDAFEKLLRLDLQGKQDREIMRVLVDCCLQEKVFNKYYCVLASKLCSYDKNHKFTLQYCLWDHFKDLESMPLVKSMHLSKFTAEMVASFSLSLAVLKAVDFNDPSQLTPKRIMHFRMLFEAIFEFPDKLIWNIFTRLAITPEYEALRSGIEFFIRKYVVTSQNALGTKFKIARKALNNVDGVVL